MLGASSVAIVVIGGHSRSVGKTSVVAGLISALRFQRGRVRQVGEDQRKDPRDTGRVSHAGRVEGLRLLRRILMGR